MYRNEDCQKCGRHRVLSDGVCEKCLWDADADGYAYMTRPEDYDQHGRKSTRPLNDPFGTQKDA